MNADKVRFQPMVLVLPRPRISTFICGCFFFDPNFGDGRGLHTFGTSAPVAPSAAVYQQTLSPLAVDQADPAAVAEQTLSSLAGVTALDSTLDDLVSSLGTSGQFGTLDLDAALAGYGAG